MADLFQSGDLKPIEGQGRSYGLFLGQFDWQQSLKHVWQTPAPGFLSWLSDGRDTHEHVEIIPQVHDIRFTGDQHHLIVASSGAGKFRDVLSNMLLYDGSCETACLIIDPKGEIASTLGPIIDGPGESDPLTVILDPWDLTGTGKSDSLTLLDGITSNNPHCVKDARVLADAIIIERGSDDGHWGATAKNFLAALLLYLGLDRLEEGERTLFRLREIVTEDWDKFSDMLAYMSESTHFDGLVARAARAMLNRDPKERRSILSTLERDTAFIEDPSLWSAIKTSSFDINQFVLSNKRLHVIVPFDYTEQMSSWLRLTIAAFYNACLRNRLPTQLPTYLQFRHIIIDEFAGLGKLDFIMKGIAEARGAGIKYHIVVQNFPQLHNLYREGWENIVSNSFIHAFGINDNFTSEYLSKLTGQATVVTESRGASNSTAVGTSTTQGTSSSSTSGASHSSTSGSSSSTSTSRTTTTGTSMTFATTGRPVLMPDEVRRISGKHQLLFIRGMPVLLTRRTPYFQTFKSFLPKHTLRETLSRRLAASSSLEIKPAGDYHNRRNPLLVANAGIVPSKYKAPAYKKNTFWQALLQSPLIMLSFLFLIGLGIFATMYSITAAKMEQERLARVAQDRIDNPPLEEARNSKQFFSACERLYGEPGGPVGRRNEQFGLCYCSHDLTESTQQDCKDAVWGEAAAKKFPGYRPLSPGLHTRRYINGRANGWN